MSLLIRKCHRWLGVIFTVTVAANFIAMIFGAPPAFITFAPLAPLLLLLFSGLYLFVLPYFRGRTGAPARSG